MKTNHKTLNKGFTLVELLVVISIIVVLAGIATPAAMKALNRAALLEGTSQVRDVKLGLDAFADDMNDEYPNDDTAEEIRELMDDNVGDKKRKGLHKSSGLRSGKLGESGYAGGSKTANDYFEQALVHGSIDDDEMFYHANYKKAPTFKSGLRPSNSDKNLEPGECVWSYCKGLLRTSTASQPLVFDTPVSTGDQPKFSKKIWDKKMIIARLDGSVKNENIGGKDKLEGIVKGKVDGDSVNIFAEDSLEGTLVPANIRRSGSGN